MDVKLERINKSFGAVQVLKDIDLVFPSRKFVTLLGPSRLRQDHAAAHDRGAGDGDGRRHPLRRPRGQRARPARPQHRHGVPVLRALSADDGAAQPRLRPARAQDAEGRDATPPWSASPASWRSATCSTASPAQLSGGQRQRVALGPRHGAPARHLPDGRAALEPRRQAARDHARGAARASTSTSAPPPIYVTHDQLEAMTMSDMIAVMHGGIVQQFGTPAEVYGQPANLFVAGFIGSPPMNFITGTLGGGDQPAFASPDFTLALPDALDECSGRARGRAGGQAAGPRAGARRHGARDGARPRLGGGAARIGEAGRGHAGRAPPHDRAGAGRYRT